MNEYYNISNTGNMTGNTRRLEVVMGNPPKPNLKGIGNLDQLLALPHYA